MLPVTVELLRCWSFNSTSFAARVASVASTTGSGGGVAPWAGLLQKTTASAAVVVRSGRRRMILRSYSPKRAQARSVRPAALHDLLEVCARRQGPEGRAPIAAQTRRAEGIGRGGRRVPDQQRSLKEQRHALDRTPRSRLDPRRAAGEVLAQRREGAIEMRVGTARERDLGEVRVEAVRRFGERAQQIERVDVPGTFPDRVDRRLAI